MVGHGEKIGRKMQEAIAALIRCKTVGLAAAECGVSERSLLRWMKQPEFLAAYREARRQVVEQAIAQTQQAAAQAVETLVEALGADKASDRIRAAEAILDRALEGTQLLDLAERLAELEAAEAARRKRGRT